MHFTLGWQQFFKQEIARNDREINLAKAALHYARNEYSTLNPEEYLKTLEQMALEIKENLPESLYPLKVIQSINQYLFEELGFIGDTKDYYNPDNSFINKVIDHRKGIPITLSIVYLEIAERLDFPMVGIGMPGHFLIRPDFEEAGIFVDVFDRGSIIFPQDCQEKLKKIYQRPIELETSFFEPVSKRRTLARMLTNLKYIYYKQEQFVKALSAIEGILILFPRNPIEMRDRGLIYYELYEWQKASEDLEFYLSLLPHAPDANEIRQLIEKMK